MVKKYIPTPNGIKIIEVLESSMQNEISRNNSIRSGANIARSSSINSLRFNGPKRPSLRLSSLVKTPVIKEETLIKEETPGIKQKPPGVKNRLKHPENHLKDPENLDQTQLKLLQLQIDQEEALAAKVELKRKQYEQLKNKRLNDEKKLKQLESELLVLNRYDDSLTFDENDTMPITTKPENEPENESNFISPTSSSYNESVTDFPSINPDSIIIDEFESKEIYSEGTIDPSVLKVDEIDQKFEIDKFESDKKFEIDQKIEIDDTEIDDTLQNSTLPDEFGIEEVLVHEDTPVSQSRPTFDNIPTIITNDTITNDANTYEHFVSQASESAVDQFLDPHEELKAPALSTASSISSDNSFKAKKPMKSAMKFTSSFHDLATNGQKSNAARDAYISLTTAENTRLNSKLSSSQLADLGGSSVTPNKRMSTLRKPPPSQRPQSLQMERLSKPDSATNGVKPRMSNRSLRDRSSVYVAPMAAHPVLDPKYQSPSKAKAAELYARANKRPVSTFNLQRKSSFSNEHLSDPKAIARTTLRHSQPEPELSHPESSKTSRFIDSDDEPHVPPVSPPSARPPPSQPHVTQPHVNAKTDQVLTLRAPAPDKPKEKKKFSGRLKKLFGR